MLYTEGVLIHAILTTFEKFETFQKFIKNSSTLLIRPTTKEVPIRFKISRLAHVMWFFFKGITVE